NTAPDPRPATASVGLVGCTISNPLYDKTPGDVESFVPPDYQLGTNAFFGPNAATVIAAVLSCEHAGGSHRPARMMVVAVQVVPRSAAGDPADQLWQAYDRSTLNFLPSSSWYIVAAETDNASLQRGLVE